jgi:hypothetical protein
MIRHNVFVDKKIHAKAYWFQPMTAHHREDDRVAFPEPKKVFAKRAALSPM